MPAIDQPSQNPAPSGDFAQRRRWMAVLARASREELEAAWSALADPPAYQWLRRPETGLAMVRARAGGTGARFNLGEASITLCSLRTAASRTGVAYILGRDHRRAELMAVFDALLQETPGRAAVASQLVERLAEQQAARRAEAGRKAAATRVDFYTMVRGGDE